MSDALLSQIKKRVKQINDFFFYFFFRFGSPCCVRDIRRSVRKKNVGEQEELQTAMQDKIEILKRSLNNNYE